MLELTENYRSIWKKCLDSRSAGRRGNKITSFTTQEVNEENMNTKRKIKNIVGILMITAILLSMSVSTALADAPSNDNFADATVITGLPFSDSMDITDATAEPGEPLDCYGWGFQNTIWYSFTPSSSGRFIIESIGFDATLVAYTGSELTNLQSIGCNLGGPARLDLTLEGETTYYFQTFNYDGGGSIAINIKQVFPPANDNFADATIITEIPYSDSVDTAYATAELGETASCGWHLNTIWYSFTPVTSGFYTGGSSGGLDPVVAVYTGSNLGDLQIISCVSGGWMGNTQTVLWLDAGITYYYQTFINSDWLWWGTTINFNLYPTPNPEAHFSYWPGDPSKFDSIQLNYESWDPAGVGVETVNWDFGDGSTSTDWSPMHTFADDGDYTVQLTLTTFDGRTGSISQVIPVRTHDVGITRFAVPSSARVGQTKQINVSIKNLYYPEIVQVDLYKSTANGYEWVGSLTQSMPIRPANRAQVFPFAYTFSSDDAVQGKVTFWSVVTIINYRDAYTPDNELISLATKVSQ